MLVELLVLVQNQLPPRHMLEVTHTHTRDPITRLGLQEASESEGADPVEVLDVNVNQA